MVWWDCPFVHSYDPFPIPPFTYLYFFVFFFLTVEVNFAHKTSKNRFLKCTECTRPFKSSPTNTLFTLNFSPLVYHLFPYSVFLVRLPPPPLPPSFSLSVSYSVYLFWEMHWGVHQDNPEPGTVKKRKSHGPDPPSWFFNVNATDRPTCYGNLINLNRTIVNNN